MQPPKDVEVLETDRSYLWFDTEGYICSVYKEEYSQPGVEEVKKTFEWLDKIMGGRKANYILDIDHAKPESKEVRDYASRQLPKYVNAFAMVGTKPMTRMMVNVFFGLRKPPFPTKVFSTEDKAREWLRQYPVTDE